MSLNRILIRALRHAAEQNSPQTVAQQRANKIAQRLRDLANKIEYTAWVGSRPDNEAHRPRSLSAATATKPPIDLDGFPPFDGEANNSLPDLPEYDTVPPSDPPDVRAVGHDAVVEGMVGWFRDNFEDPAENTPSDGGYVYIWGGPHVAEDEIHDAFDGKASKRAIREAIEQIEADGIVDWAPAASRVRPIYLDKPSGG